MGFFETYLSSKQPTYQTAHKLAGEFIQARDTLTIPYLRPQNQMSFKSQACLGRKGKGETGGYTSRGVWGSPLKQTHSYFCWEMVTTHSSGTKMINSPTLVQITFTTQTRSSQILWSNEVRSGFAIKNYGWKKPKHTPWFWNK